MARSPRSWLILVIAAAAYVLGVLVAQAAPVPSGPRLALVIGNSAYRSGVAPTAANDAGLVAQALAQDGFAVTALADPDAATLHKAVDGFAADVKRAGNKALVFVYIAGIGVQYGGVNFVLPAPAAITRQADIPRDAVPLSDILRAVEDVPAYARFFVFDLAHPTPLATAAPIPLAGGLRHMEPSPGSLYAFDAAPGMVAPESIPPYGLYARALVEALRTPGLRLHTLFARIRLRVAEETSGSVVPWDNGELDPDLMFVPAKPEGAAPDVSNRSIADVPVGTVFWAALAEDSLAGYQTFLKAFPNDPLAARVRAMKAVRLEAANWAEACRANTPSAYWTFMGRYPRGPHYVDVRRRLAAVGAPLEPPMRFAPSDLGGLPAPTADELRMADRPGASPLAAEMPAMPPVAADLPAMPPAPDGLLPPQPTEVGVDLLPPPLVPRGALPIAFPILPEPRSLESGVITQPFVPALGRLTITSRAQGSDMAMTLAAEDAMIVRTIASREGHERSLEQIDAADEIVSQVIARRAGDRLTLEEIGPDGHRLLALVTRFSLNGDQDTSVRDGADRLVADVRTDRRGVVRSVTRGPGAIEPATFDLGAATAPRENAKPPAPGVGQPGPSGTAPSRSRPDGAADRGGGAGGPAPLPPESALRTAPADPPPDAAPPKPARTPH